MNQFLKEGSSKLFRFDRNRSGGSILLHIKEDILCKKLKLHRHWQGIEGIFVEVNLTQRTQTSLTCLQDVLKRSRRLTTKPNAVKTSGKRRTSYLHRLEDVQFTTSWGRLIHDVSKTSDLRRLKTFNLRHLEDVWSTTSWGCLIYHVFKMFDLHRLEDVQFMTSSRRLIYDVLRTSNLQRLKTSNLRRLEDVHFTTSSRHL